MPNRGQGRWQGLRGGVHRHGARQELYIIIIFIIYYFYDRKSRAVWYGSWVRYVGGVHRHGEAGLSCCFTLSCPTCF